MHKKYEEYSTNLQDKILELTRKSVNFQSQARYILLNMGWQIDNIHKMRRTKIIYSNLIINFSVNKKKEFLLIPCSFSFPFFSQWTSAIQFTLSVCPFLVFLCFSTCFPFDFLYAKIDQNICYRVALIPIKYRFPVWLRNRLISAELEPVLSNTEKLQTIFREIKTGFYLIMFYLNIRVKLL